MTGCGFLACDYPVVTLSGKFRGQDLSSTGEELIDAGLHRCWREGNCFCSEVIDLENVPWQAGIKAVGNACLPGRFKFVSKFLRLEGCGTGDLCPGHLFLQVVGICVAANADGIFCGPMSWFVVQILEFEGHLIRVRVDPVDVGVDACSELLKHFFGTRTVDLPLFFHCTAVEKQAGGLVLLHIQRTEYFRELPEPTPVPDINLKQSIPRDVEALCKKQISLVLRVDVRHAPVDDQNLNWLSDQRQKNRLRRG